MVLGICYAYLFLRNPKSYFCKHVANETAKALTNNYNVFHNNQMKLTCDKCGVKYVEVV